MLIQSWLARSQFSLFHWVSLVRSSWNSFVNILKQNHAWLQQIQSFRTLYCLETFKLKYIHIYFLIQSRQLLQSFRRFCRIQTFKDRLGLLQLMNVMFFFSERNLEVSMSWFMSFASCFSQKQSFLTALQYWMPKQKMQSRNLEVFMKRKQMWASLRSFIFLWIDQIFSSVCFQFSRKRWAVMSSYIFYSIKQSCLLQPPSCRIQMAAEQSRIPLLQSQWVHPRTPRMLNQLSDKYQRQLSSWMIEQRLHLWPIISRDDFLKKVTQHNLLIRQLMYTLSMSQSMIKTSCIVCFAVSSQAFELLWPRLHLKWVWTFLMLIW